MEVCNAKSLPLQVKAFKMMECPILVPVEISPLGLQYRLLEVLNTMLHLLKVSRLAKCLITFTIYLVVFPCLVTSPLLFLERSP